MHGYPDALGGPGCRLPPHLPPHHDLMYGPPPPPDMGPLPPPPPDPSCSPPEDWSRVDPPPPDQLFPREGEGEFSYLDTSDDSGRHTGPDPSSP